MRVKEIRRHAGAVKRLKSEEAKAAELRERAIVLSRYITPEYAEFLMPKHPDLNDLLEAVWLYGMSKRLTEKKKETV